MGGVLSVGMIGAGGIARSHMNAISELDNVRVAAVMDVDEGQAREAVEAFGGKPYTDIDALLNDPEVEAVHVCTPHSLHEAQALAAAVAGKHVLVEKPMALTVEACDAMIDASETAGKVLMVGQVMRYYPISRKVKQLIADGAIGKVGHLMRRRYGNFHPKGRDGGRHWYLDLETGGIVVLYCFGPHEYDILHWYMDSPVVEVYAKGSGSTALFEGQKDTYTAVMTHANGAVSMLSQSVACHSGAHDQYIIGTEGSMMFTHRGLTVNGEEVPVEAPTSVGMRNQIEEFARCCLDGTTPDASGWSVRHTMAVIEAAKQSAERNEAVQVAEFDRKS